MKSLTNILLFSTVAFFSSNTLAAKPLSEGQALGQCKRLASTQFDNVTKTRLASMRTVRGTFKVRLRVISENERGLFLCTIDRNQSAEIVRLDKQIESIAAN